MSATITIPAEKSKVKLSLNSSGSRFHRVLTSTDLYLI